MTETQSHPVPPKNATDDELRAFARQHYPRLNPDSYVKGWRQLKS